MTLVRDRISAFASTHLVELTGVDGRLFRGEDRNRDERREISQALDFAYGLDPAGRRLPLLSDDLPVEILRRKMVIRERHDPKMVPIYAIADRFDDGQPNVKIVRDSRWTAADLVSPTRPTADRRGVHATRDARSGRPPARVAADINVRHAGRVGEEPSQRSASASSRTGSSSRNGSSNRNGSSSRTGRPSRYMQTTVDRSQDMMVDGATALAVATAPRLRRPDVRPPSLSVVRARPRLNGQVGVVAFWTVFVVGLMFAAVIMWAQNTTRSIQLEQVNARLEKEESTYTQLRVEVARLQSPQRIEAEANRLGLSTPDNITFIAPDRSETATSR